MLSVAGVVTSLQGNSLLDQKQLNQGSLRCATDWSFWFCISLVSAIPCHNNIYDTGIFVFLAHA